MKAILLAGGKGTRLRPLTVHTPKPIVPILNRPFLHYQIDFLRQVPEIDEVILSLNYQPRRIEEIFGEGEGLGIRVRYVVEPMPLGTGGAVRYAGDSLTDSVVVFNGDVLTQVDLAAVLRLHRERKAKATIVLTPVDNPRAYGLVETDANGNISRFLEKPEKTRSPATRSTPASTCSSPTRSTAFPKDTAWSIERSFFPSLIERGETFVAYVYRRLLDRHRHAGKIHAGAPRHHGRPLPGAAVRRAAASMAWVAPDAKVEARRGTARALLRRRGCGGEGRGAHPSLFGHRPPDAHRRRGGDRRLDHLAERMDWPRSGRPRVGPRPQLPHRPERRPSTRPSSSATRPSSPTTAAL